MTDQNLMNQTGPEINPDGLKAFLAEKLELSQNPEFLVERFSNGYSNLTYRVQIGNRDLVLRRPPPGANIKSGHDMEREFRVLKGLEPIYTRSPHPVIYCDDLSVIGAPFYLMERVDGLILRDALSSTVEIEPALMEQLSRRFIENLVEIHGLDWANTGLKDLYRPGWYTERQIKGWLDRYSRAKTGDLPGLERAGAWLAESIPPDTGSSLIHNDYKYDNVILDPNDLTRLAAVLDWEMATIGDPLMDLGTSLAYWVEPGDPEELINAAPRPTLRPGNLNRTELAHHYALKSGREIGDGVYYFVYGLFKVAVIVQQIYARYLRGTATDPRFARLGASIKAMGNTAALAIEKKRIDNLSS